MKLLSDVKSSEQPTATRASTNNATKRMGTTPEGLSESLRGCNSISRACVGRKELHGSLKCAGACAKRLNCTGSRAMIRLKNPGGTRGFHRKRTSHCKLGHAHMTK